MTDESQQARDVRGECIEKQEYLENQTPASDREKIVGQTTDESPRELKKELLKGWRLYGSTFSSTLCVFLANLEVSIVSTSLVPITDDLKSFGRSSWIITSYLLTYTGFLIIWAKFSDTLGRRQCLCAALVIFTVASGACGGAQTTNQLIVFRAFQGIGGSGLLSVPFVILAEIVEPQKYALWSSFVALSFVLGFLFGPLFGGAIVGGTTWRWIFLINLPLGAFTFISLFLFMPTDFPYNRFVPRTIQFNKLGEIDYLGAFLVFATSAFLVSALEEAGTVYAWSSALIIVLLVLAGLCILAFLGWEYFVESKMRTRQAVFTWRLMKHRVFMGALLMSFLTGVPFTVAVIQIPQEWQTVVRTSTLVAGLRLLPFTLFYSVGQVIAMLLMSKLQVPPVFVFFLGAVSQTVGMAVQAFIPFHAGAGKYGCEILLGVGLGANMGGLVQFTPQLIRGKDQATAMGAITQFRALGGVIGIAITTNVFNNYIRSRLSNQLTTDQLSHLLQSVTTAISSLPLDMQKVVESTFASAYDLQTKVLIGFAVGQALAVSLMWEKKLRRLL
ncbi:Efflux pump FUS6 [Lachnellula cervina]|uniref:Efflux pump FUS6 n=1 Tax=Lachnellula cervina TaxID=1316786 RepID=A0A7D8YNC6_9HELO|nr:Efflux pump FUS6 [Lachnellula cervina]